MCRCGRGVCAVWWWSGGREEGRGRERRRETNRTIWLLVPSEVSLRITADDDSPPTHPHPVPSPPSRESIRHVSVCTGTTRTCVSTCARGAGTHGDVLDGHIPHTTHHTAPRTHHTTPQHHTPHAPHATTTPHGDRERRQRKIEREREEKEDRERREDERERERERREDERDREREEKTKRKMKEKMKEKMRHGKD